MEVLAERKSLRCIHARARGEGEMYGRRGLREGEYGAWHNTVAAIALPSFSLLRASIVVPTLPTLPPLPRQFACRKEP